jgi:DNA replication protein DnaC
MAVKGVDAYAIDRCDACRAAASLKEQTDAKVVELGQVCQEQRAKWRETCGLPLKLLGKTFANFEKARQPKAFKAMDKYDWRVGKSLVLLSHGRDGKSDAYGLGKSHLCGALVNKIVEAEETAWLVQAFWIQKRRCPVLYITETQLIDRIKASFNDGAGEPTDAIYKALTTCDLLIIDDVGKEPPKDYRFLQSVYFRIIDGRDGNKKPIILTTNLKLDPELEYHLGGPSADRLNEMCGDSNFVSMTGKSYRREGAKA